MEKPSERLYAKDPFEMIARDRQRYIAAALTIPLAYLVAGSPNLPKPVNGFSRWSKMVRAPLMWLGEAGPASTMSTAREGDPRLQASAAMLAAMADLFGLGKEQARTAAQMISATDPAKGAVGLKEILAARSAPGPQQKALREALMGVAGVGKEISPNKLGYWLRATRERIIGGLRLCGEQDKHAKVMRWWIEPGEG
jgi:putative DNA primase/helicase